jgi:hypothetical protein
MDYLLESFPGLTSGKIIDMDNDILVFNTLIEKDYITSVLNKLSDKNTKQDEDSGKDLEQDESSVDPIQDMVISTEASDMLGELECFVMKNNTELLKCISGAKNCFNKQIIT